MGEPPSRNVTPGHVHGDNALAQTYSGKELFFEFADTFALGGGKPIDLLVGKPNILLDPLGHSRDEALLFLFAENEIAFPPIKFSGQFDDGRFTALFDVGKDFLNDAANFCGVGFCRFDGFFEVLHVLLRILSNILRNLSS